MICISPAIVLVPLRPAPATNRTLRGYVAAVGQAQLGHVGGRHGGQSLVPRAPGSCGHRSVAPMRPEAARAGAARASSCRPTTWRRYLPGLPRLRARPGQTLGRPLEVVVVDDGSPDDVGRDRRVYAARDPRVRGRAHRRTVASARPATRGCGTSPGSCSPSPTPTTSCRPAPTPRWPRTLERTGSDFVTGSVVRAGRASGLHRAALDAAAAPAADGPRHRLGTRRSSATCSRGTSCSGPSFWRDPGPVLARGRPLRGPADDHAGLPRAGRFDDRPRGRLPLADPLRTAPRSPSSARRCRTCATGGETKRMSLRASRSTATPRSRRRLPSTGCWPATCTATSPRSPAAPTSGGCCSRSGVRDLWGDRSLTHSGLLPVHRLVGWLVEQDRREDAAAVACAGCSAARRPAPREGDHLVVPAEVLDVRTVDPAALALREHER